MAVQLLAYPIRVVSSISLRPPSTQIKYIANSTTRLTRRQCYLVAPAKHTDILHCKYSASQHVASGHRKCYRRQRMYYRSQFDHRNPFTHIDTTQSTRQRPSYGPAPASCLSTNLRISIGTRTHFPFPCGELEYDQPQIQPILEGKVSSLSLLVTSSPLTAMLPCQPTTSFVRFGRP